MHVLAFFAASDGIVMENLAVRFMSGGCSSLLPVELRPGSPYGCCCKKSGWSLHSIKHIGAHQLFGVAMVQRSSCRRRAPSMAFR